MVSKQEHYLPVPSLLSQEGLCEREAEQRPFAWLCEGILDTATMQ